VIGVDQILFFWLDKLVLSKYIIQLHRQIRYNFVINTLNLMYTVQLMQYIIYEKVKKFTLFILFLLSRPN